LIFSLLVLRTSEDTTDLHCVGSIIETDCCVCFQIYGIFVLDFPVFLFLWEDDEDEGVGIYSVHMRRRHLASSSVARFVIFYRALLFPTVLALVWSLVARQKRAV